MEEIQALLKLLEDPDPEVFDAVSGRLVEMGNEVLPSLEKHWEYSLKEEQQTRIENLIRTIQLNSLYADMDRWKAGGGKNLLHGAWLVARTHYPELAYQEMEDQIEKIKRDIWLELNGHLTALEKVRIINYFLFNIYKFDRSQKKADTPQLYLVNHVLDTLKGSPVVLGLLYAELARRLDMPIYGVNLPRNFILCYYDPEYHDDPNGILFYINPSDKGNVLGRKELTGFLKQIKVEEREAFFSPCSHVDIIERLILNLQFAYSRNGLTEKAGLLKRMLGNP